MKIKFLFLFVFGPNVFYFWLKTKVNVNRFSAELTNQMFLSSMVVIASASPGTRGLPSAPHATMRRPVSDSMAVEAWLVL